MPLCNEADTSCNITRRENEQTSVLVFLNKKSHRICIEKKANESSLLTSLCASHYFGGNRRFLSIVESVVVAGAFCQRAFERLEPIAGKLARWVLRGGSGSNAASLPDWAAAFDKTRHASIARLIIGIHIFLSQLEIESDCPNSFRGIAGCLYRFKFPFQSSGYSSRAQ